jgi:hypothetical protein
VLISHALGAFDLPISDIALIRYDTLGEHTMWAECWGQRFVLPYLLRSCSSRKLDRG